MVVAGESPEPRRGRVRQQGARPRLVARVDRGAGPAGEQVVGGVESPGQDLRGCLVEGALPPPKADPGDECSHPLRLGGQTTDRGGQVSRQLTRSAARVAPTVSERRSRPLRSTSGSSTACSRAARAESGSRSSRRSASARTPFARLSSADSSNASSSGPNPTERHAEQVGAGGRVELIHDRLEQQPPTFGIDRTQRSECVDPRLLAELEQPLWPQLDLVGLGCADGPAPRRPLRGEPPASLPQAGADRGVAFGHGAGLAEHTDQHRVRHDATAACALGEPVPKERRRFGGSAKVVAEQQFEQLRGGRRRPSLGFGGDRLGQRCEIGRARCGAGAPGCAEQRRGDERPALGVGAGRQRHDLGQCVGA